jgi:hypothetical protein
MNHVTKNDGPAALSYIAIATGALALGAVAVGALAIGRLVIGRLAVQKVRLQAVEIDNLTVRRLRVLESDTPGTREPAAGASPDAATGTNGGARPTPRRKRPRKTVPNAE